MKKRKPRSDRNHIVYKITCVSTKEIYIGITVVQKRAILRSIKSRLEKHFYRAFVEQYDLPLYESIRKHGRKNFKIETLLKVRGKKLAHKKEKELVEKLNPSLNVLLKKGSVAQLVER